MRFTLALILISSLASAASSDARLTQARTLVDDLDPEAALKVLDAIERTDGNSHQVVLEVLLLQGIAWGTLGKDAKTRDSFRKLLMLAPETKLPADLPPRVKTPFFEARDWAGKHGPMVVTLDTKSAEGQVTALSVNVEKDVYRVAKTARLTVSVNGDAPTVVELPLNHSHAEYPLTAKVVTWSVEVIGERKAVLLVAAQRTDGLSPQRDTAPVVAPLAAVVIDQPAAPSNGWRRPLGTGLAAAGGAAVIVGAVFGSLSSSSRARATPDDTGVVSGVTQRQSAELEKSAIAQATTANVLFGVGAGLAAAGVVLIILGPGGDAPTVSLAPAPGGVVLNGSF